MFDASGRTLQGGDKVRLGIAYRFHGKSYPAGTVGVYQRQKSGAGFLTGIVDFNGDLVEVSSMDIVYHGAGTQLTLDDAVPKASISEITQPLCRQCRTALQWFGGGDNWCPKCCADARYMKI